MPPKTNTNPGAGANPLASMLGGGGQSPITPEMTQLAMSALPQLIKLAQRVPAWTLGYFVGVLWWIVVVPLTSSSVLTFINGEDESAIANMASLHQQNGAGGLFSSIFGSSNNNKNDEELEWDSQESSSNAKNKKERSKNNKKAKKNQKRKFQAEEDEDEDDEQHVENDDASKNHQQSSFSHRLRQCNVGRGHSMMRCLYSIQNSLLSVIVGLLLLAFVSSGAAIWWQNRQEERRQHERAKAIVQDILQMNRKEKFD